MIRKKHLIFLAVFALLVAIPAWGTTEIVAKINGVDLSRTEFEQNWANFLSHRGILAQGLKEEQAEQLKKELLNGLVDQELLFQDAQAKNFLPDDGKVSEETQNFRKRFPTEEAFLKTLERNGLNEESFKDFTRKRLSIQGLVDGLVAKDITVTTEEIHDFYVNNPDQFNIDEQVKARHILIKVDAEADEAAREAALKKSEEIMQKAKSGADFAELAKEYSEGPTAPRGGDLGFFSRGRMVKPFEEVAFSMKPGEISKPVLTQFGYHIIKVEEVREAGKVPEEEAADHIRNFLMPKKINQALLEYIQKLREGAKIEILM